MYPGVEGIISYPYEKEGSHEVFTGTHDHDV